MTIEQAFQNINSVANLAQKSGLIVDLDSAVAVKQSLDCIHNLIQQQQATIKPESKAN